ncbi:MAG TPA: hypothetical protein VNU71_20265 [Burkholderiaceae bacterium]|nr:hypothetical protein [Burkholderiaceae bacterium]
MSRERDQLRSAFGCGSAGAAEVSLGLLEDGAVDESGVVDCAGAAGWAGAALLSDDGCGDGVLLSCAGAVLFGIGSGLVAAGWVWSLVAVCADTKPTAPTIVAAAIAAVRVLSALIVILLGVVGHGACRPRKVGNPAGAENRLAQP